MLLISCYRSVEGGRGGQEPGGGKQGEEPVALFCLVHDGSQHFKFIYVNFLTVIDRLLEKKHFFMEAELTVKPFKSGREVAEKVEK